MLFNIAWGKGGAWEWGTGTWERIGSFFKSSKDLLHYSMLFLEMSQVFLTSIVVLAEVQFWELKKSSYQWKSGLWPQKFSFQWKTTFLQKYTLSRSPVSNRGLVSVEIQFWWNSSFGQKCTFRQNSSFSHKYSSQQKCSF